MINIISRSILSRRASGPGKVVKNLIMGLEKINYPFVLNARLDACDCLWIHDDIKALKEISTIPEHIKVVIGPNLFILPESISEGIKLSRTVYLQPSQWVKDFWEHLGFNQCPLAVWPAGIDTDFFSDYSFKRDQVIIYFKQRNKYDLTTIEQILNKKGIKFRVVNYGDYTESNYRELLAIARYVIWLGSHESQGIALGEAMSVGVPAIICDVKYLAINGKDFGQPTGITSAPYFDSSCGIKINNLDDLSMAIDKMETVWQKFYPRQYVLDNLNLEKQAREFLLIYTKYFGLDLNTNANQTMAVQGRWRNGCWWFKIYWRIKELSKILLYIFKH